MKIFAIGRNYAEHVREFGNEIPEAPVVFLKPDTALIGADQPFIYPDFSSDIHFELEVVLRVSKQGRNIPIQRAMEYVDALTLGIDFTARDLQAKCKAKGLPWEVSKSFDGSAAVGRFVSIPTGTDLKFQLVQNGQTKQDGNTRDMIHSFAELISYISKFFTLAECDLIYTGTPSGVGPVQRGDVLEGYLLSEKLLSCPVK